MKPSRVIALIMGFLAGIAFVVSCGGGGGGGGIGPGDANAADPTPQRITITQTDAPVGSIITVGGTTYTIVQFEVPRFDTDEVYFLKYPSPSDFAATSTSDLVQVGGIYPGGPDSSSAPFITALSGFDTRLSESYNFNGLLSTNSSGRTVRNSFNQTAFAQVLLGPETRINLFLTLPAPSISGTSPTRSADASGIVSVYPPARNTSERSTLRQDLRNLVGYITLTKKV